MSAWILKPERIAKDIKTESVEWQESESPEIKMRYWCSGDTEF